MIRSFGNGLALDLFHRRRVKGIPDDIRRRAERKLWLVDAATSLEDLRSPPADHLELLQGELAGRHSIRINDQWRIVFQWCNDGAHEVEVVDYHS